MNKSNLKNNFAFWKYKNNNITCAPCECQGCEIEDISLKIIDKKCFIGCSTCECD
jgi:hypothetical protein